MVNLTSHMPRCRLDQVLTYLRILSDSMKYTDDGEDSGDERVSEHTYGAYILYVAYEESESGCELCNLQPVALSSRGILTPTRLAGYSSYVTGGQ